MSSIFKISDAPIFIPESIITPVEYKNEVYFTNEIGTWVQNL